MEPTGFHPLVAQWWRERFGAAPPTPAQVDGSCNANLSVVGDHARRDRRLAHLIGEGCGACGVAGRQSGKARAVCNRQQGEDLARFEEAVAQVPEIMECHLMTGDADYLIRVAVPDMAALERFILENLTRIPGIKNIKSSFALKQVKYKTALPISGSLR